ncbi:hypothetical protein ACFSHQ_11485 [Gemmobacter lanyuensis]
MPFVRWGTRAAGLDPAKAAPPLHMVNADGVVVPDWGADQPYLRMLPPELVTHQGAQMNHYMLRSEESWGLKRGTPSAVQGRIAITTVITDPPTAMNSRTFRPFGMRRRLTPSMPAPWPCRGWRVCITCAVPIMRPVSPRLRGAPRKKIRAGSIIWPVQARPIRRQIRPHPFRA